MDCPASAGHFRFKGLFISLVQIQEMAQNLHLREASLPLFPMGDDDEAVESPPVNASGRLPSYIADHRKRLRDRFRETDGKGVADYELLELILFRAIGRQDVKPLARRLLDRFGDIARVISAPIPRLMEVHGVGDAVILELKLVEVASQRMARARVLQRPVLSSWSALLDYCHTIMSHAEQEHFRILFLDRKNVLIADEEQSRGTIDYVPVYPREVVKRALELGSSALILVHNHPSGDPTPSSADVDMTRQIAQACAVLGITLHDHLIIGRNREISLRAQRLI